MTDQPLTQQPTRQQIAARDRTAPGKVTGKLRRALDLMVWQGKPRDEAAAEAGMSVHGLREALRRPHVRQALHAELEVLRTSERPRNIHALAEIRDQSGNQNARVAAVRTLEQMAEDGARERPAAPFSGLVVQVITNSLMAHERQISDKPLISHDTTRRSEDE